MNPQEPSIMPALDNAPPADMPGWAIRLEAKVDAVLIEMTNKLGPISASLSDHETRLRSQEQQMPEDAKVRLREMENRRYVTPTGMWSAVVGATGVLAAASPLLSKLYGN